MAKLMTSVKSYGQCLGKQLTYSEMTGADATFQITGGPIVVYNLGFLVTTLMAGTNTLKFRFTPLGGTITDLSGATDSDAAAAQQLFVVNGTKATATVKCTDVGILAAGQTLTSTMPIILSEGTIYMTWSASSTAGAGLAFMEYLPLSQFTKVEVV